MRNSDCSGRRASGFGFDSGSAVTKGDPSPAETNSPKKTTLNLFTGNAPRVVIRILSESAEESNGFHTVKRSSVLVAGAAIGALSSFAPPDECCELTLSPTSGLRSPPAPHPAYFRPLHCITAPRIQSLAKPFAEEGSLGGMLRSWRIYTGQDHERAH